MKIILDDRLNEWQVKKGDPGYEAISVLHSLGFTYIVLPSKILAGVEKIKESSEVVGYASNGDFPVPSGDGGERIRDCLYALMGGRVIIPSSAL